MRRLPCRVVVPALLGILCAVGTAVVPAYAAVRGAAPGDLELRLSYNPASLTFSPAQGSGAEGEIVRLAGVPSRVVPGAPAVPEIPVTIVVPGDRTVIGVRAEIETQWNVPGVHRVKCTGQNSKLFHCLIIA